MKVIIELDLPDEEEQFDLYMQAGRLQAALISFDDHCRSQCKYADDTGTDWFKVREKLHEYIEEYSVSLNA